MTGSSKLLCIYHGGCDDGFGAAWAVRHWLGSDNVEFYPGVYSEAPPDVTGRDVVLVDFSYRKAVLLTMIGAARSLLVLDHHKTAQEDLSFLTPAPEHLSAWTPGMPQALFDMKRSGAGLAWDFFSNGAPRIAFINYLEDRDLWRRQLPQSDEFTIGLRSYPQDFAVWDDLSDDWTRLITEGVPLQRYYRQRVEELKARAYPATILYPGKLGSFLLMVANAPYFAASEVAGEIAGPNTVTYKGLPAETQFGACYFEVAPNRWQYSLRSRGDFDVSAVAKLFGGGGHKAAAGFTFEGDRPVHIPL